MDIFNRIRPRFQAGSVFLVATVLAAPAGREKWEGVMLCLDPPEPVPEELQTVTENVKKALLASEDKKSRCIGIGTGEGEYTLFVDWWRGERKVLLLGGGHISRALMTLLALLDYSVTIVDDRPDFANCQRFPEADRVICGSFQETLSGLDIKAFEAIIIVTRGHKHDLDCLRRTIEVQPPYLGMIGSRKRVRETLDLLREEGVAPASLAALHSPIGLDIGGETPEEIAVSIVAELIAARNGKLLRKKTETREAQE